MLSTKIWFNNYYKSDIDGHRGEGRRERGKG